MVDDPEYLEEALSDVYELRSEGMRGGEAGVGGAGGGVLGAGGVDGLGGDSAARTTQATTQTFCLPRRPPRPSDCGFVGCWL